MITASLLLTATLSTLAPAQDKNVVETAAAAGSFQTLATALTQAQLVDALQDEGPFTVFAPTDAAFAKLPEGTVKELLRPANRERLTAILTYHVVPGRLRAADVARLASAQTLSGQRIDVTRHTGGVRLDKASVVQADIECSNGIIHVIDQVLMPETRSLAGLAAEVDDLSTLFAAVKAAGLGETLAGEGPFTVFAPTNSAFAKLPEGTVEELLKPENKARLTGILTYHVLPGRLGSGDLLAAGQVDTLQEAALVFGVRDGRFRVNDGAVVGNDVDAANGVVHLIDSVLMPPQPEPRGRKVLGIYLDSVSEALAAQLGIDQRREALLVSDLVSDGNAQRDGVRKFDIITAVDGMPATNDNLSKAKESRGFGGRVELQLVRRGKPLTLDVEVGVESH